ncbi:uncharacterized protein [Eurosta solidaginis]|uniref:uncharacterized protein n=1 Tax=Eurosta solidaginis TaxID=178769 RepID=UPI0035316B2F
MNFTYLSSIISLNINIDGLPLYKSTKLETWPILIDVNGTKQVLVAGIYAGYTKPCDPNAYLEEFVHELGNLVEVGMMFQDRIFQIEVRAFICDALARAFILGVKYHSGFFSCNLCVQKGESFSGRRIFRKSCNLPRTNEGFRSRLQQDHHNIQAELALEKLPIDMVNQFSLDYMHVVCLGVMKSILVALTITKGHKFSLSKHSLSSLNNKLEHLKKILPREFNREVRSLDNVMRFKATELRTFLLYTGPIVLRGILDTSLYNHFLLLSLGIRLLLHTEYCVTQNSLASSLLDDFVSQVPFFLYGFNANI